MQLFMLAITYLPVQVLSPLSKEGVKQAVVLQQRYSEQQVSTAKSAASAARQRAKRD